MKKSRRQFETRKISFKGIYIPHVNSSSPSSIETKIRRLRENKGDLNIGKFEDSLE
jgi:hypothetical protein